ncbi:hypothetical protein IIA15_03700 [candidate division TA06 bacterium]|nr:hypothetical protein [candidate division TA06 bacterium]
MNKRTKILLTMLISLLSYIGIGTTWNTLIERSSNRSEYRPGDLWFDAIEKESKTRKKPHLDSIQMRTQTWV